MMRLVTFALVVVPAVVWFVREYRWTPPSASDVLCAELLADLEYRERRAAAMEYCDRVCLTDDWSWPGDVVAEEHAAYAAALADALADDAAVARWLGVS